MNIVRGKIISKTRHGGNVGFSNFCFGGRVAGWTLEVSYKGENYTVESMFCPKNRTSALIWTQSRRMVFMWAWAHLILTAQRIDCCGTPHYTRSNLIRARRFHSLPCGAAGKAPKKKRRAKWY